MKVRVIRRYNDLELGRIIEEDAEIEVTKQRAEKLLRLGFVQEIKQNKVKSEPLD